MLENSIAELLQNGIIQRHLRKSLRLYRQRRDLFCGLLKDELSRFIDFEVPDGGMAVWARFDRQVDLPGLADRAFKKNLYFSDGLVHNKFSAPLNATRLGFASSSEAELTTCIQIMAKLLRST